MIILDTPILLEAVKANPAEAIVQWLDAQNVETLYATAIAMSDAALQIMMISDPVERIIAQEKFNVLRTVGLKNRVLPFDVAAFLQCEQLIHRCHSVGDDMYEEDFKAAQMLSIALIHKYAVAGKAFQFDYFENTGIKIIDPWNDKLPTAEIIEVNCEGIFYTTFFDHTDFTLMQVKDGWSVNARLANGLCERPDTIYPNLQAVQKNEPAFDQLFNTFPKLLKKPINRTINIRRSI